MKIWAIPRQIVSCLKIEPGDVLNASARSQAVSGVTPRLPRTTSFIRCIGTPKCSAKAFWD
jgi:hypothetical protein